MCYVNVNLDELDRLQLIKEQQRNLFDSVCCNQKRHNATKRTFK